MRTEVIVVVGARPNFMKAAPLLRALKKRDVRVKLVHTGQHYDHNMSDIFFRELELPPPTPRRQSCGPDRADHGRV